MDWRGRGDLWYGLALVRPFEDKENAQHGGAYVTYWVRAEHIVGAIVSLANSLEKQGWSLTSLENMKCAADYVDQEEENEAAIEDMSADADRLGIALGAFHCFPRSDEIAS